MTDEALQRRLSEIERLRIDEAYPALFRLLKENPNLQISVAPVRKNDQTGRQLKIKSWRQK